MARAKPWYHSRTLWLIVAFVVLSLGVWAQQAFLPDYPLPDWVGLAKDALFGVALAWLRGQTNQPIGRGRKGLPQPQETLFDSGSMVDPKATTQPEQKAIKAGWNDPELG